ncbi:MAG TPA: hypothetical protein PJ984_03320 [Candidatus Saccharibacteria bacterium]|jgi:hypothetical protein|nr:hypothetical protein [Patescibacteria group bacterium]HMS31401.1 hypothetical protein [Candidatus Saccharibacteria bacterium]
MKYGSFEFGDKQTSEKPVEQVLAAGAVGTLLGHSNSERESNPGKKTEDSSTSNLEITPQASNIPERKINPVRRTIRSIALKQAIETTPPVRQSAEVASTPPPASFEKPPVPIEQMQPVHINQVPRPKPLSKEVVRSVEQSSTEELLRVANKLHVEGTTVRKLYEANKIDHRGLVAIVKESLRGGDIKRAYKKARLGAEAQQGRKIEMRHDDPAFIPADVRPEISDYGKKRVETITSALEAAQHSTPASSEARTQSSVPTPADHGYQQVKSAMRKKRIATITISATLALSGAAAIAWFLFG